MTKGIASWGWSTVPQKHMNGRVFWYTLPKVIGGGSTINAQLYNRGNKLDFDEWRQQGCEGWSYEDVLPYFLRAEGYPGAKDRYHNKDGPLGVGDPLATLPICEAFIRAGEELGIPHNHDFNGDKQDGLGYYQLTQRDARRSSVVTAYLKPAMARPNLTVRRDVFVSRIIVESGRATAVEVAGRDRQRTARGRPRDCRLLRRDRLAAAAACCPASAPPIT